MLENLIIAIIVWILTYITIVGYVNSSEYRIGDGGIRRIKRSGQKYRTTYAGATYEEALKMKK